jgi:4,5-DOPA dioxygenase extradiol
MLKPGDERMSSGRRVVLAGGALALGNGLPALVRSAAAAQPGDVPAPDGRPLTKGRAPSIFIGHGSPMNAVQDNTFTRMLRDWGGELGRPRAILMVSAHWLTDGGTQVSLAEQPATIHDFGGFPPELYAQRYPAPGAPGVARAAAQRLAPRAFGLVPDRGLDHGAWTVLKFLYPAADVPVFQLSIDINRPSAYHLAIGRAVAGLRDEGVMVIGSGNVVHNLRATMRGVPDSPNGLAPWAEAFDQRAKQALDAGDSAALLAYERLSPGAETAVPFPDHYYPMLYALGAAQQGERARHRFEGFQAGTLSMRCVQWG